MVVAEVVVEAMVVVVAETAEVVLVVGVEVTEVVVVLVVVAGVEGVTTGRAWASLVQGRKQLLMISEGVDGLPTQFLGNALSPEYALDGLFSVKSDIFSFGVILLEIVSGKKNNNFYHSDESLTLLGYAWKLWKEDKGMDITYARLSESTAADRCEMLKCIQLALLCVQEDPADRPIMASIVTSLITENASLPMPKQPPSYVRKYLTETKGWI